MDLYLDAKWILRREPHFFGEDTIHAEARSLRFPGRLVAEGVIARGKVDVYWFDEGIATERGVRISVARAWTERRHDTS